jgi:DNA-binding CsgD family transcriptional regulator
MSDHPLARYADLLQRLPALHDGLRLARDVGDLLSRGTALACAEGGFDRGVVVGVRDGRLTADASDVLAEPASDDLRRQILAAPPELLPTTIEAELVRRPNTYAMPAGDRPSVLAETFGLANPAFGIIAPEGTTVGLLVVDRAEGEVDDADRSVILLMGRMLSVVLEHVVMRARVAELSAELRYLTVTTQALATEAFQGPIALPVHGRHLPAFRAVEGTAAATAERARSELTEREIAIATLLAQGRSNREIAENLYLSTETVKDHVARIIRKLGAANRVEAAIRFVGLDVKPPGGGS